MNPYLQEKLKENAFKREEIRLKLQLAAFQAGNGKTNEERICAFFKQIMEKENLPELDKDPEFDDFAWS